jgi:hypothetical protein
MASASVGGWLKLDEQSQIFLQKSGFLFAALGTPMRAHEHWARN